MSTVGTDPIPKARPMACLLASAFSSAYLSEDSATSEMFMVANRSVGTGLTASAVFLSWMWINETWWGAGLCFQIALMAALGVMAKTRVPYAHTSLEIIKMRYRTIGHLVFIILNLVNNVFGCAFMILTGSQLVSGVSGMHFVAATILIPLGVVLYTAVGGLKAAFLTDFLHTAIALILIIYFTLSVLTNEHIGGLGGLYDKVVATACEKYPGQLRGITAHHEVKGSHHLGVSSEVWKPGPGRHGYCFWQKSFASEVNSTVPAYNLAAIAVFGIPWGLGTVLGLSARALDLTPIFPTYPADITETEVSTGLVMPLLVKALIGESRIVAFFVLLFMALTTDRKLLKASHVTVVIHAVFITGILIALNYGGANMTWLGYFRPVLSCPGIIPLGLTLFWSGQTKLAAFLAPVLGFFTGLAIWLGTAHALYGEVNMTTTGNPLPALYGAIGSFFPPVIYSVLHGADKSTAAVIESEVKEKSGTLMPQFDASGTDATATAAADLEHAAALNKPIAASRATFTPASEASLDDIRHPFDEEILRELYRWMKIAWVIFGVIVLVTFILWPMPLYRNYIFSKSFFSGWVSVDIVWQFFAFSAVVIYPLYDGRYEIDKGARGLWRSTKEFVAKRRSKTTKP
ncbi:hypothetical protein BDW71DRAFT_196056 [Aspergillus fruticulosus]